MTDEQILKALSEIYLGATEAELKRYLLKAKKDGYEVIERWEEKKRVGEIKNSLIKIYPAATPEEIEKLKQKALDAPEWYKGLEKSNKVKNRLRAEYASRRDERPSFTEKQLEELSTQSHEEWFQGLGRWLDKDYLPRPDPDAPYVDIEAWRIA
jgi:hypothetical protein